MGKCNARDVDARYVTVEEEDLLNIVKNVIMKLKNIRI
jgi:hypothetical protein